MSIYSAGVIRFQTIISLNELFQFEWLNHMSEICFGPKYRIIVTVLNPSVQPEKSLHGRCSTITVLVIIFLLSIIGGLSYKHWELIKENKQLKFMVGESHGEGKELN